MKKLGTEKLSNVHRFTRPMSGRAGIDGGLSSGISRLKPSSQALPVWRSFLQWTWTLFLPTLCFSFSHVVERGEKAGFATKSMCLTVNTDHFQIYHRLGIIWEQGGLPNLTELLFLLRSTGLLFLTWLEDWGPQGAALAAGHFERSVPSVGLRPSIGATSQRLENPSDTTWSRKMKWIF